MQISEKDQLERLDERLAEANLEGHWRLPENAGGAPTPFAPAHLWDWHVVRALLFEAGEITAIEGVAGRRTVRLCTPGFSQKWTTPTIHASVQMVKPGEIAAAHRHSLGALRFVIEGSGGYTTVDGAKLTMEPGDLILTPVMTWHDHGHEGNEAMVWIDGHDVPFSRYLNSIFFEGYPQLQQPIVSDGAAHHPYVYKGSEARASLAALGDDANDPCFGITLKYRDHRTGGTTLPTIACRLSRLQAGQETARHRRTANLIYHVVSGAGTTLAGDKELDWQAGDIFVVPGWTWHQHQAGQDAVFFSMSDEAILEPLGLLRVETQ